MDHKHWYNSVEEMIAAESGSDPHAGGYTKDQIETELRRWTPENDSNIVMDTARDIGRGAIALADSVVGLGDMAYNAVTGESFRPAIREMGWTPDEWDREIALRNSFARQDADAAVQGAEGLDAVGAYLANPRALGGAIAQQIPLLAGTIGGAAKAAQLARMGGAISPRAAAIAGAATAEGSLSGGSVGAAVGDHYAETGEDPGRRIAMAGTAAGVGTGLIGAAMGPLGGAVEASIGARMAGRVFANAMSKTPIRRGLKSMAGEGLEEALQSGQEQAWQNYGTGAPLSEDVGTQMAVGGLLGGVMGGMLHPFTGPSAHSQKNLMPGANATGEQQRNAKTAIETEEAVRAKQELMRRQYQAQQAMEGRPMQAIPTEFSEADVPMMGGAVAGGTYITPNAPGSYQPQVGAINPTPGDMTQAPANQQMALPEPAPQAPDVPNDLGRTMLGMSFTYPKMASDLNKRTIATSDGQGKTVKQSINEAFPSLTPTQRTYVMGSIAARKATGQLTPQNFARSVAEDIETARAYIQEDTPQALQEYVDRQAKQTVTKQSDIDYNDALNNALGSQPSDARYASMPFGQRIMEVSTGMAPQVAEQAAQPAADQTLTQQPQPEQTPPQQEAVPATPVAAQQAEAKPSQAPAETKKAIPDTVDEMAKKDAKPKLSERSADAVPAALATTKAAIQRDAKAKRRNAMADKLLKARRERKSAEPKEQTKLKETAPKVQKSEEPKASRFARITHRGYTDEQEQTYRKRYSKLTEVGNKLAGDERKINDGDKVAGNTVKRLVNEFLDGRSTRSPMELINSLYNWLTPESLELVRHAVENNAITQGGNAFDHIRWFAHALDEAVEQKRTGAKTLDLAVAEGELARVNTSAEDRQITPFVGTPSLHMDSPTELNVEFFDTPEYREAPKALTEANLMSAGVQPGRSNSHVKAVLRRAKQTIEGLRGGTLQLMVPSDDSGGWGQTNDGLAKPMLRVVRKAVKTGHKGWKNLTYANGDRVGAADQAVIFERLLWSDLKARSDAADSESDYDVPSEIREAFQTNDDISRETMRYNDDVEGDSTVADGVSLDVRSRTVLEESNRTALQAAQEALADHSANKNTKLDVLANDFKSLLPLLLKNELLGTLTTETAGGKRRVKIERNHPFLRFLNNPKDVTSLIYGFSGSAMYEPASKRKGIKPEQLEQLIQQGGTFVPRHNDTKHALEDAVRLRGASATSTHVLGAWRRTAANIGTMIGQLERPIEDRKQLLKSLNDFVRSDLLPPVNVPTVDAESTPKQLLDNRFYAELNELRGDVATAFRRSMQAANAQTNNLKQRWSDRVGAKDSLFNNRGSGLITAASNEGKALREQFKDFVANYFKEKTGNGINLRRMVPLETRIRVYNTMTTDLELSLAWTSPTTAGREQFPNGRFEFTNDLDVGEDTVEDFDPADLWTPQWVEASGLFTQEELEGSKKHFERARGKGNRKEDLTGTPGSADLYNRMREANLGYASRIHYGSMYGAGEEALAATADAEITRNELKVAQREQFVTIEQAIDAFLDENSTTARIEDSREEFLNVAQDYTKALIRYDRAASLEPQVEEVTDNMSAEQAAEVTKRNEERTQVFNDMLNQANAEQEKAYNKLEALTENLVKTTVKKRGEVKAQLMELAGDYAMAWEALNGDVYEAQLRQTQSMIEEGKRLGLNKEAIDAIWRDRMEDRRYYDSQMSEMDDETLTDILENGSEEQQQAVLMARDIVDNIARAVTFFQAHGEMQTSHYALAEISNRIQEGLTSDALKGQGSTFTDALAAYLKRHYERFGGMLNEDAMRLNAEMRQELEVSGFDPDTNADVKAAFDRWQDLKDQWFDAPTNSQEAEQLYTDMQTAANDYWAARENVFRGELQKRGFTEVFNKKSQSLSMPTQVEVHKRAVNAVNTNTRKAQQYSAAEQKIIDSVLAKLDPTVTPETAQDKDAFIHSVVSTVPTSSVFSALKGTGVTEQNMRVLKVLVNRLQHVLGNSRANKLLSKVNIGFFDPRFGVTGLFYRLKGMPTIWIPNNATNLKWAYDTFTHEVTHALFNVLGADGLYMSEDFDFINRHHSGTYKPVGALAKEIKQLNDKYAEIFDLLRYPLDTLNEYSYPRLNAELLAQMGTVWLSSIENRNRMQREAPKLHKIFTTYFLGGKGDGPSEQAGRPLARLDGKNSRAEARRISRSETPGRESNLLQSGRGQLTRTSLGSGKSTETESERQSSVLNAEQKMAGRTRPEQSAGSSSRTEPSATTNSERADGNTETQRSERRELVDSANKEAARIANPEPSFIQRIINRLPAERRPLAQVVADTAAGWFGDYGVSKFLGALFTSDLARMVNKVMPSIKKWIDLKKARDAWINTRQQELGQYRQRFNDLDKDTQTKLNTLWADTTLSGTWIARPKWMTAKQWKKHQSDQASEADRIALQQQYDELSPEAQSLYDDVLQYGHDSMVLKNKLIAEKANDYLRTLEESASDATELKDLKDSLKATVQMAQNQARNFIQPYVPLLRRGSHVVVARSEELASLQNEREQLRLQRREDNGWSDEEEGKLSEVNKKIIQLEQSADHYVVSFVDSQAQANRLKTELEKDFNGTVEAFPREEVGRTQSVSLGMIHELENQLAKRLEDVDAPEARKMIRKMVGVLNEMYTMNLADYHANKNQLHRLKVAGFDENMMNNFLDNGYRETLFYGNVKYQKEIQNALRDMRNESNISGGNVSREIRKRVLNEVMKREQLDYDYKPNEVFDKAQRVTSVMMLLTSPAFYLQNMTQSFMMTCPWLAHDFSGTKVFKDMADNTKKMIQAYFNKDYRSGIEIDFDKVPWMTAELKEGLGIARSRGLIDIGISQDFGHLESASKFQELTDYLSRGARVVEMVNRVASFTTAFNLKYAQEKAKGNKDAVQTATDYACEAIYATHGDYSATNEPRYFKRGGLGLGGAEKLIFQFRKFQLIQIGLVMRMAKAAFAGASPEARAAGRRAFAYMLGTHFTMTGLAGTPLVTTLAFILNGIFGDDDDSTEDTLRKWIGDKDMSNLLIKGLPAYLGVDVSERIGAANMFSPFPCLNATPLSGREGALETVAAMAGPFVSQFVRMSSGLGYMSEGDMYKGVEMMLPNGLTNAMRAFRYATEGYTTKNGTVTIPPEEYEAMDVFFQALGLPTTITTDRYRLQNKLMRTQDRFSREEAKINKEYRAAETWAERRAAMQKWVKLQKERADAGLKPKPTTHLQQNKKKVDKDAKNAVGGLVVNNSNKAFVQYWANL